MQDLLSSSPTIMVNNNICAFGDYRHSAIMCPFCKHKDRVRPNTLPKNFEIVSMLSHYPTLPPNQVRSFILCLLFN
jgi:hypothetical protein